MSVVFFRVFVLSRHLLVFANSYRLYIHRIGSEGMRQHTKFQPYSAIFLHCCKFYTFPIGLGDSIAFFHTTKFRNQLFPPQHTKLQPFSSFFVNCLAYFLFFFSIEISCFLRNIQKTPHFFTQIFFILVFTLFAKLLNPSTYIHKVAPQVVGAGVTLGIVLLL